VDRPLSRLFAAALAAVDPAAATARTLERDDVRASLAGRRLWVAAAGKAARAMAEGAVSTLGDRVAGGIVVAPTAGAVSPPLVWLTAEHPVPGSSSVTAARAILALAAAVPAQHALLALVSGGASALIALPGTGLTLAEKVARVRAAVNAGAPIAEVNRLRISMSAIKGGRLAATCRAPVITVVVSDVVGDDLAVVGSGPTIGQAAVGRSMDRWFLASGIADLAAATARVAREVLATEVQIVDAAVTGDIDTVAGHVVATIETALARGSRTALVWTGEPTVRLGTVAGRGGRARHLALLVARELRGRAGWSLLCAGSDGVDGTSDAAGAIVDGLTWERIIAAGHDPDGCLAGFDSGTALAAIGAAVVTGPTGVNHADLLVADVAASVL
jgi:glycerate-2-kinase